MDSKNEEDQSEKMANLMRKGLSIMVIKDSWMTSVEGFRKAVVIKLVTGEYFNVIAVASILKKTWNADDKEISFEEISGYMAVAKFQKQSKLDEILDSGPFTFQNQFICVKKWIIGCKPENLDFDKVQVWVQLHNIPQEYMGEEVTKEIATGIGRIIKSPTDETWVKKRKYARYMVELDINSEIPEGAHIRLEAGNTDHFWISFKFERLQLLCSKCRVITHKSSNCPHEDVESISISPINTFPEISRSRQEMTAKTMAVEEMRHQLITESLNSRMPNDLICAGSNSKKEELIFNETLRTELSKMDGDDWKGNKKRKGKDKVYRSKRPMVSIASKELSNRYNPYKRNTENKLVILDGQSNDSQSFYLNSKNQSQSQPTYLLSGEEVDALNEFSAVVVSQPR